MSYREEYKRMQQERWERERGKKKGISSNLEIKSTSIPSTSTQRSNEVFKPEFPLPTKKTQSLPLSTEVFTAPQPPSQQDKPPKRKKKKEEDSGFSNLLDTEFDLEEERKELNKQREIFRIIRDQKKKKREGKKDDVSNDLRIAKLLQREENERIRIEKKNRENIDEELAKRMQREAEDLEIAKKLQLESSSTIPSSDMELARRLQEEMSQPGYHTPTSRISTFPGLTNNNNNNSLTDHELAKRLQEELSKPGYHTPTPTSRLQDFPAPSSSVRQSDLEFARRLQQEMRGAGNTALGRRVSNFTRPGIPINPVTFGGGGGIGGFGQQPVIGDSYEELLQLGERIGDVSRGTSKQQINNNSLEFVIKDLEKDIPDDCDDCMVCYEAFEVGDNARRLKCLHIFHVKCIDKWLENYNAICPICRAEIKN